MKELFLTILIGLTSGFLLAQESVPETFFGEWTGEGTLFGNDAQFEMKWEEVLNGQFIRLSFENRFSNGGFSMTAHGYYKLNEDGTFTGQWFDSRGVSFPLKGVFTSTQLTTEWEHSDVEKGRTEYEVLEQGTIRVIDFVFRDGSYQKFAEATYQLKNK